ncbi:kinase-like domain-containing protein [Mycena olivaceomarginata]|nr:kinase-like domain-containing protein [Mycena olivaceomarginata]
MAFPGKHLAFVHHGIFPDEPGFEPSAAYESGGLCSIHLDNTLGAGSPPRYRIVSPNSVGAVFRPGNVVLKTVRADALATAKEVEIQRLRALDAREHPVVELLDAFDRHSAMGIGRRVIHQIITGAAAIHSSGIIHGDFHPGNFGFAAPELNKFSDIDLWDRMPIQDLFPPHSPSMNRIPLKPALPSPYAAPEIVFAWEALNNRDMACDQRSDIWSLALCIYAIVSSTHIFSSKGMYGSIHILVKIVWYCDQMPEAWRGGFKEDPFPLWVEQTPFRETVEDPPELIKLLRRMMALDPAKCSTAAEILRHPYFDGMQTD